MLTRFWQGNRSVDERHNAVQTQAAFATYPWETAKILHRDIFWFFFKDEEFVSKTINDSSINLDKFLRSKVKQFAEKMESSEVTAMHIKQVAGNPLGGSDQYDEAPMYRPPSKQTQEEETLCEA